MNIFFKVNIFFCYDFIYSIITNNNVYFYYTTHDFFSFTLTDEIEDLDESDRNDGNKINFIFKS